MPDVLTISASVIVTLTVQGAYFVFMKFPGMLHKHMAALARMRVEENSSYAIYKNVQNEIKAAKPLLDGWKLRLMACCESEDQAMAEREYFREVLPKLTATLGRLQGLSSSLAIQYSTDPLPDFIWLFDKARRLSRTLASYSAAPEIDLVFELSDIQMVEQKVNARLEQMPYELEMLQVRFREGIEQLSADISEMRERFVGASLLLILVITYLAVLGLLRVLPHVALSLDWRIALIVVDALSVSIPGTLIMVRFYKSTAKRVSRIAAATTAPKTPPEEAPIRD
jgi:hypothetical protein